MPDADSRIQLYEPITIHDHGMATIKCLLAASKILHYSYQEDERMQEVVQGVLAFVLYASDFWLDGLLHAFNSSNQDVSSILEEYLMCSSDLATALNLSSHATPGTPPLPHSSSFGPLLVEVQKYGAGISSMTRTAVASRLKTSLDPVDPQGCSPPRPSGSPDILRVFGSA